MRPRSALTPTFMPFRPAEAGWVAYHDVRPASGPSGLAMTWRVAGEGLRWVAAVNRVNDGWVTGTGRLREGADVTEGMDDMLRGRPIPRAVTEAQALALLFPHADHHPTATAAKGLPPLAEHADLARRAVAEADLIPAMRAAFRACLDNGAPHEMPISSVRRRTQAGEWSTLALAAKHPELVRAVLRTQAALVGGDDPMAALRQRWPGMTDAHLRRLAEGRHSPDALPLPASHGFATLNLLFAIPVDWWPKPGDWQAFQASAFALAGIASGFRPGMGYAPLIASSKGDWPSFAARLQRAAGMDDRTIRDHALATKGRDCGDPVRALLRDVMVPLVASRQDDDGVMRMEYAYGEDNHRERHGDHEPCLLAAAAAARDLLYGGKSAPGILETSRAWHGAQAVMQAQIRRGAGEAGWPPLFEGEFRDGDVGVVAIRDYDALRAEGAHGDDGDGVTGLDHCIVSRLPECLGGRAHVLSVRRHAPDGTWRRLSTCEVAVEDHAEGRPHVSVAEHRGRGNAEPSPEAVAAVSRMSEALLSGALVAEPLALARRGAPDGGSITRKCGYDWRDPEELAQAVRTWEPFLPRWARGLGPDGLYDALVEREILPAPEEDTGLRLSMG